MDRLFRIAASRWTERICCVLILLAVLSHDTHLRWIAGTAVALTAGLLIAGSIGPLRAARRTGRDFPHTPEYEEYARSREAEQAGRSRHRIERGQAVPHLRSPLRWQTGRTGRKSLRTGEC